MTFLLDSNVVSYFFQALRHEQLAAASKIVPCAIVDVVEQELRADPKRGRRFEAWQTSSQVTTIPLLVGTAGEELYRRRRYVVFEAPPAHVVGSMACQMT